jgi:adenylosuccinate synthase
MRVAFAIVGANFGDEGKGLFTDAVTRLFRAKHVARFNGGAQAGHTVVDCEQRHVFGHVASGLFAGADTYLSSRFIVNPYLLTKELTKLKLPAYQVYASPQCRVTTVYDMVLNNILELARDNSGGRHGSCGVGINETVTRNDYGFTLSLEQLACLTEEELADRLELIKQNWVPLRAEELGITHMFDGGGEELNGILDVLNLPCAMHAKVMKSTVKNFKLGAPRVESNEIVVLEGAQGLALDEELGAFPHVTRSITGLPYALLAANELGIDEVRPVYCTRAYLTRHGNGPLENDGVQFHKAGFPQDATNVENDWQGKLRYAPLNVPKLQSFISQDYARGRADASKYNVRLARARLAVSCLDHVPGSVKIRGVNNFEIIDTESLPSYLAEQLNLDLWMTSTGPSNSDVRFHPLSW